MSQELSSKWCSGCMAKRPMPIRLEAPSQVG